MGFTAVAKHRVEERAALPAGRRSTSSSTPSRTRSRSRSRACTARRSARSRSASKDAAQAYRKCVENGAWGVEAHPGPMELNIPAIKGIGDSLIYLVDRYPARGDAGAGVSIYDIDFVPLPGVDQHPAGAGLTYIDHLTHNVHRGRMDEWASFYERLFNFREVRYFDIEGKLTGLKSQGDDEPLRQDPHPDQRELRRQEPDPGIPGRLSRRGHPARRARHRRHLRDGRGAARAPASSSRTRRTPTTRRCATRLPGHGEDTARLAAEPHPARRRAGARTRCCCRSSRKTVIGPIFFEIIQRKGNAGLRRRQLPRAVRVDRAGPDPARRAEGLSRRPPVSAELGCSRRRPRRGRSLLPHGAVAWRVDGRKPPAFAPNRGCVQLRAPSAKVHDFPDMK